jgi:hypothetical protein
MIAAYSFLRVGREVFKIDIITNLDYVLYFSFTGFISALETVGPDI